MMTTREMNPLKIEKKTNKKHSLAIEKLPVLGTENCSGNYLLNLCCCFLLGTWQELFSFFLHGINVTGKPSPVS